MNVASEPTASWSEGESQKWTGTGQLATYVGTTQGLGEVFEDTKKEWKQVCAFRQAQCPRMNTLDFKKLDIE
jgi:hypothetical protein